MLVCEGDFGEAGVFAAAAVGQAYHVASGACSLGDPPLVAWVVPWRVAVASSETAQAGAAGCLSRAASATRVTGDWGQVPGRVVRWKRAGR